MNKEQTYRFAKIKRHDFDFPPYWVVVLDSLPRVMRYLEEVKSRQLWEGLRGAKNENERNPRNPHYRGMEHEINWTLALADEGGRQRQTVFDDMMILGEVFNTPYLKVFFDRGILYVNGVGGFLPASSVAHEVLEERESAHYEFPVDVGQGEVARIFQWKGGGTHYYAKIGAIDVVVDGKQKWNTWKQAEQAVQRFMSLKEVSHA